MALPRRHIDGVAASYYVIGLYHIAGIYRPFGAIRVDGVTISTIYQTFDFILRRSFLNDDINELKINESSSKPTSHMQFRNQSPL